MDVREKLAELLENASYEYDDIYDLWDMRQVVNDIADFLIAHGVTVQEWIPVSERLPEDGEIVLVCGSRGGVYTAVHNKPRQYRGWHKLNSKSHYCDPTHWMPLPQPPKGE